MLRSADKGNLSLLACLLASWLLMPSARADAPANNSLILWLDAMDVDGDGNLENEVATNSKLARWIDKSGHGNHVEQKEKARQPTVVHDQLGGKTVLRFDGDDLVTRDKFTGFTVRDQPIHMIVVMKSREGGSRPSLRTRSRLIDFQPAGGDLSKPASVKQHGFWIGQYGDGRMRLGTHYGDEGSALSVAWDAKPHVVEVIYTGCAEVGCTISTALAMARACWQTVIFTASPLSCVLPLVSTTGRADPETFL